MPSLPMASTQLPPAIEQGLRALLVQHLQAQGLVLAADQLAASLDSHRAGFAQWLEHCVQQGRALQAAAPQETAMLPPITAPEAPVATLAASSEFAAATPYVPSALETPRPMPDIALPTLPIPTAPMPLAPPIETPGAASVPWPRALPPSPAVAAAPIAPVAVPQPLTAASPPAPMPIPIPTAAPVTVRLPNATAGRPYSQPIDLARLPQLAGWQLLALQIPAGSGLSFDAATCQLQGTPQAPAGQTHEWPFQGRLVRADGSGSERPIRLDLLVNPDPRSLWKEIEPEPGKPFAKPHQQAHVRREASWQAVAASQRGRSHANVGSFREDHFHFTAHEGWILLAVSDGAGSAKLSRRGSELACETAIQTLQDDGKSHLSALAALVDAGLASGSRDELHDKVQFPLGTAAFMACKAIGDEAKRLGREEKEFAATLLLAAVRPHAEGFFVASYWIGDGALAIFDPSQSTVQLLGEADGGEFSGQTRFLLATEFKPDPWEQMKKRIRSAWAAKTATLVLMSDGVSDPKFGTDNALKDPARWQQWWQDLAAEVDLHGSDDASLSEQLLRYLAFWSPGEHDDRTLALWQFAASPAAGSRA